MIFGLDRERGLPESKEELMKEAEYYVPEDY